MADCNALAVRSSRLGVDICACLFVDHCCVQVFIRVLNFHGWSQPRNYFNSEIFLIYGMFHCTHTEVSRMERSCLVVQERA